MSQTLPSWCLLLREHRPDRIDSDYMKKQGLLSLDLLCESKRAWGFGGDDGGDFGMDTESLMRNVKVQARVSDAPNLSFLTMTLERDEEEPLFPILRTMDKNLVVFVLRYNIGASAYLIYDTVAKTLSMIPLLSRPDGMAAYTKQSLIARPHAAVDDGSYALVILGKMAVVDEPEPCLTSQGPGDMPVISWPEVSWPDVLFQWQPSSSSSSPWKLTKKANLPQQWMADNSAFSADVTFSFEGHAFWVDLMHGVLFCTCADLLSDDVKHVDFDSIDLPLGCLTFTPDFGTMAEPRAYRTMGHTGNSIKFVSMHFRGCVKRGVPKVTVWRLELHAKIWVKEHVLNLKTLWTQPAFLAANLPRGMAAMYPVLSMHEEHVIYFMLGEYNLSVTDVVIPRHVRHFLCVDMLSATLVSSTPIPSAYSFAPTVMPSDLTSYLPHIAIASPAAVAPTVSPAIATAVSPATNAFAFPAGKPSFASVVSAPSRAFPAAAARPGGRVHSVVVPPAAPSRASSAFPAGTGRPTSGEH